MKFLEVKAQTPYMLLLLETRSLPIERVIGFMFKVLWEASKKDAKDAQK